MHQLQLLVDFLTQPPPGGGGGVPNPSPQAPPGLEAISNKLVSWVKWGVLVGGVVGLLICAGQIVIGRRNRNQLAMDGIAGSAWVMGGLALASVAAGLVGVFAL